MDVMTGVESRLLGIESYTGILASAGLSLIDTNTDESDNFYYFAKK